MREVEEPVLRACDFFDLFVLSAHVTLRSRPPKTVILSEAPRRSFA